MRLNISNPNATGTAYLLLSGGPGLSSAMLEPLPAYLHGGPVVTVDMPGTGGAPGTGPFSFTGLVETLERELSSLPYRRYVAVGFSFGGFFAASLAARQRVEIAAFVGIATPLSAESYAATDANFRARQTAGMRSAEAALLREPTDARFKALLTSLVPLYFTGKAQVAGAELLATEHPSARQFFDLSTELATGLIPLAAPALASLTIPKIVIAGAEDGMTPPARLEADAVTAGAAFHLLMGASHFVHAEQPGEVARLIRSAR